MDFEKWQALGNDYVIVEAARASVRADAGADPRDLRPAHRRVRRRDPAAVRARRARVRRPAADLQPRRLRGGAVGQRRARGDPLPAPPRLDRRGHVLDPDGRRRDPRDDHLADDLHGRHGPGAPAQRRLPVRRGGRARRADRRRAAVALSARRRSATRSARSRSTSERELDALDLAAIGPEIEHHELFPNRTNVSWYAALGPGRIRARIFERGVGETSASGTGATGAAVAYVLRGRRLAGDRRARRRRARGRGGGGPAHQPDAAGRCPCSRGTLADEFVEELHATE